MMNIERDESLDVGRLLQSKDKGAETNTTPPKKKTILTSETKAEDTTSLERYKHGDIIVGTDGVGGIVIDREKKLKDMVEWDTTLKSVMNLGNQEDVLFDKMTIQNDVEVDADPAIEYIKNNPNSEAALKLIETKQHFRNYEVGPNGLVNAGDANAKNMREAMDLVRSGKVILPTVEEYEKQQKELKRKQMEERRREQQPPEPKITQIEQIVEEQSPTTVDDIPIEEMEDSIMTEETQKEIMGSANMDAFNVGRKEEPVTKEPQPEENRRDEPKTGDATPQQPINLAMLEQVAKNRTDTAQAPKEHPVKDIQPEESKEEKNDSMTIEVPMERADTFMEKMPESVKEKVEVAKKIKVCFIKDLILPKATRQIVDVNSYRRMAPRNVRGDIQAQPLINSGYIGYFNPCGSLKWNNLAPQQLDDDEEMLDMDIGKLAQFCYEQLAFTSIGKMSRIKFMSQTSASDIPDMLYAIMKASLPDNQEVNMLCGRKSCQKYFEGNYSIAGLPDFDKLSDKAIAMIQELQSSMHMMEDALDTHNNAPVMLQMKYTASSTGTIFVFKHRDIGTVVDRSPVMESLADIYGNSSALLSMYITEVYIKVRDTGNFDDDYARSTDPAVICEELFRLSSDNLDEMREIVPEIPMIETFIYSIKGEYVCPHCGNMSKNPAQDIIQMAFQVALKARFFV